MILQCVLPNKNSPYFAVKKNSVVLHIFFSQFAVLLKKIKTVAVFEKIYIIALTNASF